MSWVDMQFSSFNCKCCLLVCIVFYYYYFKCTLNFDIIIIINKTYFNLFLLYFKINVIAPIWHKQSMGIVSVKIKICVALIVQSERTHTRI